MNDIQINKLAEKIYEQNKAVGWWDDPNRCIYQTLQLVSTEIAEATEGERKELNDDHLTWRAMGEVELADALIRILDLGGRYMWIYKKESPYWALAMRTAPESIAGKHLMLNMALIDLTKTILMYDDTKSISHNYSVLIDSIVFVAEQQGYDVWGALSEKLEYNQKRADHKRENRAKEGGKKF